MYIYIYIYHIDIYYRSHLYIYIYITYIHMEYVGFLYRILICENRSNSIWILSVSCSYKKLSMYTKGCMKNCWKQPIKCTTTFKMLRKESLSSGGRRFLGINRNRKRFIKFLKLVVNCSKLSLTYLFILLRYYIVLIL